MALPPSLVGGIAGGLAGGLPILAKLLRGSQQLHPQVQDLINKLSGNAPPPGTGMDTSGNFQPQGGMGGLDFSNIRHDFSTGRSTSEGPTFASNVAMPTGALYKSAETMSPQDVDQFGKLATQFRLREQSEDTARGRRELENLRAENKKEFEGLRQSGRKELQDLEHRFRFEYQQRENEARMKRLNSLNSRLDDAVRRNDMAAAKSVLDGLMDERSRLISERSDAVQKRGTMIPGLGDAAVIQADEERLTGILNGLDTQIAERRKRLDDMIARGSKRGGSSKGAKTVLKRQYSKTANKTKIIYSDGSEEVVDGRTQ